MSIRQSQPNLDLPPTVNEQRERAAAMRRLFQEWLALPPEYDRETWAELQRDLDRDPVTMRHVHDEEGRIT